MNKELTEIAYILDRSGSMNRLQEAAISSFNTFLKDQQDTPGDVNFTLALFDYEYTLHADRAPIKEVRPLDAQTYVPRGSTALLDAIGRTVKNIGKQLAETPEPERPAKVIIAIYTDGYENSSTDYTAKEIAKIIKEQTDTYNWEFLFLAANEDAIATAASYGIKRSNASHVDYSQEGLHTSSRTISRKVRAHRSASRGTSTRSELKDLHAELHQLVEEESKK